MAIQAVASVDVKALSGPALRTFFRIAETWRLSVAEQMTLLGFPARSTFFNWKKESACYQETPWNESRISWEFINPCKFCCQTRKPQIHGLNGQIKRDPLGESPPSSACSKGWAIFMRFVNIWTRSVEAGPEDHGQAASLAAFLAHYSHAIPGREHLPSRGGR